jgi:hypothetical protein
VCAENVKITQIVPESGLMANLFPQYLSDYCTEKLRERTFVRSSTIHHRLLSGLSSRSRVSAEGVNVQVGRMVKSIEAGKDGKLSVLLDNKETLKADHVRTPSSFCCRFF